MNKNLLTLAVLTIISAQLLHAGLWGKKKAAKPKKDTIVCLKKATNENCIKECKKKKLEAASVRLLSAKELAQAKKKCKKAGICNCVDTTARGPKVIPSEGGLEMEIDDSLPEGALLVSLPPQR